MWLLRLRGTHCLFIMGETLPRIIRSGPPLPESLTTPPVGWFSFMVCGTPTNLDLAAPAGFEPATLRLTGGRTTDCATAQHLIIL